MSDATERGTPRGPFFNPAPAPSPIPATAVFTAGGEQRDLMRMQQLGFKPTQDHASWLWPASFFVDENGNAMWQRVTGAVQPQLHRGAWIEKYCRPVLHNAQPLKVEIINWIPSIPWTTVVRHLAVGMVVVFNGPSWINPAVRINHSAIVTGHGDEVSQKWWSHPIQAAMANEMARASANPVPRNGVPSETVRSAYPDYYPVTRGSISDLVRLFTIGTPPAVATHYFVGAFAVYEISDDAMMLEGEVGALVD